MKPLPGRWAAAALAASSAWGCAGDGSIPVSGSTREVTIQGRVTLSGKPAAGGELVFDPVNVNRRDARPRRAPVGPDGTYTVTTLVGQNAVSIEGPLARSAHLGMRDRKAVEVPSGPADVPIAFP